MNERSMQFQIGIFAIVAGLVLTMLVVWFGERPGLLRDQVYLTARFVQAPGINVGVPVRKSGIRIGEVASVEFDDRPESPDSVLVTLALDKHRRLVAGSRPRISRSLIGDVNIDVIPGTGTEPLGTSGTPGESRQADRILEGEVSPDPARALEAASAAFEKAGGTLAAIQTAAENLDGLATKAGGLDEFLDTWKRAGEKLDVLAEDINRVIRTNEQDIAPTMANLRDISRKVNDVLDDETQAELKVTIRQIRSVSARLDTLAEGLRPLAQDLGGDAGSKARPTTQIGQLLLRANKIAFEVGLLTDQLYDPRGGADGRGGLNRQGSLQRLVASPELYDNFNELGSSARDVLRSAQPILKNFKTFSDRIANDPSQLTRGALRP